MRRATWEAWLEAFVEIMEEGGWSAEVRAGVLAVLRKGGWVCRVLPPGIAGRAKILLIGRGGEIGAVEFDYREVTPEEVAAEVTNKFPAGPA